MLPVEHIHAEGARYAAALVLVPGLWAGPAAWRQCAGLLGHRGWECHLLDPRAVGGDTAARGAAIAEYVAALAGPAIVVGHDAGGLAAALAATRCRIAALVLVAPLAPGSRTARALARSPRTLLALVRGGTVAPPVGRARGLLLGDAGAPMEATLGVEEAGVVRDAVWGPLALPSVAGASPVLVLAGNRDPLCSPADAAALARMLGGEVQTLDGAGHWPLAGPSWQRTVDVVHRWLVRQLGAPLLELYEEAMADREEDGE